MGQSCTICNHSKRINIDRELISGKSVSQISREYDVSIDSLRNHRQNHLSHQLVTAIQKKQLNEDFDLLARIDDLLHKTQLIFDRNFQKKRDHLALKALGEQRNTLELLAKISWALHEAQKQEEQQNAEQMQYEQEQQLQEDLSVLTLPELEMFKLLSQKLETQDKSMKIIPEKSVTSNWVPQHFTMQSDDRPNPDPNDKISSGRLPNTSHRRSKFVRTKPPRVKKD